MQQEACPHISCSEIESAQLQALAILLFGEEPGGNWWKLGGFPVMTLGRISFANAGSRCHLTNGGPLGEEINSVSGPTRISCDSSIG